MAYAAVLSLLRTLQEIKDPVLHDKQQIESLQEKVSFLHDFLEKYSVCTDKLAKELEIKIRDAAYESEDIIESYISASILSEFDGGNSTVEGFQTFYRDLDRVIVETHSIELEVMKIKHLLDQKYEQQGIRLLVNRSKLSFSDKAPTMVGLDEDNVKVKDWLTSSSSNREVISIVGMGGIGKTTFVRNLFDDSLIVCKFDVRAWVTVSQEYQMPEIFEGLLDSTNKLSPEMKLGGEELADRLYKSLKDRKYMIVMDDVWDAKVWDEVKRFFPDDHNGSRVVLTTRLKNVGDYAASFDYRHDMRPLDSGESWDLFCEKVFRGECCPSCLEGIGQEIIKNCRGLPLSIVVIGGLLSMDKTVGYWESIATTLKSVLSTDGGQCSTIFSLSYNHVPAHLKPCFLYFAIFPEDYIIRRSHVINLWIAEGFIKPNECKSLEDIAEECLEDLLNRSLIMALDIGQRGKVKSYRIHDLLRDFCVAEAQKEKFLHVTNMNSIHSKGIRSERRVSIQPTSHLESIEYAAFNSNEPPSPTRSLLFYHENTDIFVSEPSFGLLRVLDMGSGNWLCEFPEEVVRLVRLRYLSLRCICKMIVPVSISSLWGLQTLVLNYDTGLYIRLPMEIWTMLHLRHIEIRKRFSTLSDPPNSNFVVVSDLQTLSGIINFRFTNEIIKRISKLKKLKVSYLFVNDWSHYHLSNIVWLNELESLHLSSYEKITFTPNIKFPTALKKLTLYGFGLGWEDLTMVGSLPSLEILVLCRGACKGGEWEPNEGEFPQLKFLELYDLYELEHWRADDSHFPKLECLKISRCWKLKEIPIDIGNIPTLEKIQLDRLSSVVDSAKLILDRQRSFGNDVLQLCISD